MATYAEYKVIKIQESGLGSLSGSGSGLQASQIESELNRYAASGWQVVAQVAVARNTMFGTDKVEIIVTLGR